MRHSRASGMTLIEVLATLLVISVTLPVVLEGASLGVRAARASINRLEASSLAASKLDELAALAARGYTASSSGDFGSAWPDYRWTALLMTQDYGLEELTVIVTKTGTDNRPAAQLSTLIYRPEDA